MAATRSADERSRADETAVAARALHCLNAEPRGDRANDEARPAGGDKCKQFGRIGTVHNGQHWNLLMPTREYNRPGDQWSGYDGYHLHTARHEYEVHVSGDKPSDCAYSQ